MGTQNPKLIKFGQTKENVKKISHKSGFADKKCNKNLSQSSWNPAKVNKRLNYLVIFYNGLPGINTTAWIIIVIIKISIKR